MNIILNTIGGILLFGGLMANCPANDCDASVETANTLGQMLQIVFYGISNGSRIHFI